MDKEITVQISLRQALALPAALLDLGINRHAGREHLSDAELRLTKAVWDASKSLQDDCQATRSPINDYQADGCL